MYSKACVFLISPIRSQCSCETRQFCASSPYYDRFKHSAERNKVVKTKVSFNVMIWNWMNCHPMKLLDLLECPGFTQPFKNGERKDEILEFFLRNKNISLY